MWSWFLFSVWSKDSLLISPWCENPIFSVPFTELSHLWPPVTCSGTTGLHQVSLCAWISFQAPQWQTCHGDREIEWGQGEKNTSWRAMQPLALSLYWSRGQMYRAGYSKTLNCYRWISRTFLQDITGGPGVKTLRFQCRGHGFNPRSGNQDPTCHVALPKKEKEIPPFSHHPNILMTKCAPWKLTGDIPLRT